ncbi:MAG: hypothetical protein HYU57_06260 [Micavibrio aeruginosavorus]|nr:hypothetical protein [Micavibrio aeruginosavorus]
MKRFCLAALLFCAAPAHAATCMTGDPFPFKTRYAIDDCPADIQGWLDRVNACAHFEGEEGYDGERRAFLADALEENRCAAIGCDFQELLMVHENDDALSGVLSEYAQIVYGNAENLPECMRE